MHALWDVRMGVKVYILSPLGALLFLIKKGGIIMEGAIVSVPFRGSAFPNQAG